MMAFFLIDGGAMDPTSTTPGTTHYQPLLTSCPSGIQRLQRNEPVYAGWGSAGAPPVNAHAFLVAIPKLPGIQEFVLVSQHPGFPPGQPLSPTVAPLQPKAMHPSQQGPLIRPDSDPPSYEECNADSYQREDLGTYEPEDFDTYESHTEPPAQAVVDLAPSKQSRRFAGDMSQADLAGLHRFTTQPPPQIRVFDLDEIRLRLIASRKSREPSSEASQVRESRDASVSSSAQPLNCGNPVDLDPAALVDALQTWKQVRTSSKGTMFELKKMKSFDEMVPYVETLEASQASVLAMASWGWRETNREASQLMALLFLFNGGAPPKKIANEFLKLLPAVWPRKLEHLRERCLTTWGTARYARGREKTSAFVKRHYGTSSDADQ
jgi:hypothetical protein